MDSPQMSLGGDLRFRAYAAAAAVGVVAVRAVCFWRLYRLTVSARPQDMLPVSAVSSGAGAGGGKAALGELDISALPVFVHVAGCEAAAAVECAVCLGEVRDGERGRLRAYAPCPPARAAAVAGEPGGAAAAAGDKGDAVAVAVVGVPDVVVHVQVEEG